MEYDVNLECIKPFGTLKNFVDGWERDGASLAVFVNGTKVVDLWGGYADLQAARKWKQAGLGYLDTPITEEIAADHNRMREILENEHPKWEPGRKNGYHPFTFGWIVDQIVRHVDEKKRSIGQFLREEITNPHHIDYHIGLPLEEEYRVARVTVPSMWERFAEVLYDWRVSWYFLALWKLARDTPLSRAVNNPSWLQAVDKCTMNNPEYHRLEQAAALGIGNARSLAAIFNLVATKKLIGDQMLNRLQHHYNNDTDVIFDDKIAKGHGFLYLPLHRAGTEFLVGHTGHGCQQVAYDLKNKISIAYVSNGLKTGLYNLCRTYSKLQDAVYDIVESKLSNQANVL
ncbi:beta-lactamase [Necator americanus]|uniref:Beta-lactamase n=1 Tax=Necator americanus TaxID=51031 RepID=W2T8R5_NECAM|nr:beta-lactamase [Necator americanus]ETN78248.1 beta-lactamase [Necator americanus]